MKRYYTSIDLPVPPRDVLERYFVAEPQDTRFRSCARLLQSIWRERKGLSCGIRRAKWGADPLGSLLAADHARSGLNFLRPDIAKTVRRELAYRERGAMFDEARVWENLLASSALVFNLFGPLRADSDLAVEVLRRAFCLDVERVDGLRFETSPGRGSDDYIGDGTALDVLVAYQDSKARSCFIGIEVKYSEDRPGTSTPVRERLLSVARRSQLFTNAEDSQLHRPPLRQFFAEHSLCFTMVHERAEFEFGSFAVVAPSRNFEIQSVIDAYERKLHNSHEELLPFRRVNLESVVGAMFDAGEVGVARMLDERYLDFSPIYDLIDNWEPHRS